MLAWCLENRPSYVITTTRVDEARAKKAAEDLLQDGAPLEIKAEPQAIIAGDLGGYLQEGTP